MIGIEAGTTKGTWCRPRSTGQNNVLLDYEQLLQAPAQLTDRRASARTLAHRVLSQILPQKSDCFVSRILCWLMPIHPMYVRVGQSSLR